MKYHEGVHILYPSYVSPNLKTCQKLLKQSNFFLQIRSNATNLTVLIDKKISDTWAFSQWQSFIIERNSKIR